jgi:type I restriction enzyme S subunit
MTAAWPKERLNNVLRLASRETAVDPVGSYRLLGIRLDGLGPFHRETVLGAQTSAAKFFEVKTGDFIYSRLFAWRGAFGMIDEELNGCHVSNEFPTFEPIANRIDIKFLRYWFRSRDVLRRVETDCSGSTPLTRNRYKEQFFLALEIPLPPMEEQRRIVRRIEELFSTIQEATNLRGVASVEIEALLASHSRQLFEACNADIVDLEQTCTTIIDNLHSNPVYADEGIPCIRSPDVGFGTLDLDGARRTEEAEYRRRTVRGEPQPDDIVLVREGGGTGKCAIVMPGQRFSLGQRVMMLRPNPEKISPRYLFHHILSPVIQENHIQPLSKGSASPHLNIGALRKFPIKVPTFDEQRRIVAELDALRDKVDAIKNLQQETAAELDALVPAILDQAFKGQL